MLYLYNHMQVPRPIFNWKVLVDGELVQKDLPPGATLPLNLAPGKHEIQVKVSINKSRKYPVQIENGKDYYLNTGMYFEDFLNSLGINTLKIKSPEEDRLKADPFPRPINWVGLVYSLLSGLITILASLNLALGTGQTRGTVFLFGFAILAGSLWLLKRYPFHPRSLFSIHFPYFYPALVVLVLFWISFSLQNFTAFWLIMGLVIAGIPVAWYSWQRRSKDPNIRAWS